MEGLFQYGQVGVVRGVGGWQQGGKRRGSELRKREAVGLWKVVLCPWECEEEGTRGVDMYGQEDENVEKMGWRQIMWMRGDCGSYWRIFG